MINKHHRLLKCDSKFTHDRTYHELYFIEMDRSLSSSQLRKLRNKYFLIIQILNTA